MSILKMHNPFRKKPQGKTSSSPPVRPPPPPAPPRNQMIETRRFKPPLFKYIMISHGDKTIRVYVTTPAREDRYLSYFRSLYGVDNVESIHSETVLQRDVEETELAGLLYQQATNAMEEANENMGGNIWTD